MRWPYAAESIQTKRHIGAKSFFEDCVGFIDVTLITFSAALAKNEKDYWTRESVYALNPILICDNQHQVIYAHHGWCGISHDQWVLKSSLLRNFEVSLSFSIFDSQRSSHRWSSSQFYSNMSSLFSEGEYILANYDYASLENIFPTFKRSHLNPLTPAQNHFNNALAKLRVASEHWNGMLKGMPGFLKELIPVILDEKSARNLCAWLAVCVVLHSS